MSQISLAERLEGNLQYLFYFFHLQIFVCNLDHLKEKGNNSITCFRRPLGIAFISLQKLLNLFVDLTV